MANKLKSGNAIVRLLLSHGEKMGIFAILVCTGLVIYSAIGRERLDKEPSQLDSLAQQTNSKLANFTWNELSKEDKLTAQPLPPSVMTKIPPESFPPLKTINPPISDPVTLRTDPVLLAVTDLEVNADSGLWASANPEMIKQKMLDAEKERLKLEQERAAAREKADRGAPGGRGEGAYGGGEGYGEGRGGLGARGTGDATPSRDAPIVERPRGGAQLQGFEDITAKSWVTILAKLPIQAQTKHFTEALASSRGYNQSVDIPRYLGYQVERAEVTSKGQSEWEMIKFVKKTSLEKEYSTYPVDVEDVIDPKVKHPILTHRLPPLILQEWGERVSHSSMPLAADVALQDLRGIDEEDEPEDAAEPKEGEDDLFSDVETGRGRTRAAGRGRGGEFDRGYGGGEMGIGRGGYGRGGGGYGGEGMRGGGEYGGMEREFSGGREGGYGGEMSGGRGGFGGMRGQLGQGAGVQLPEFTWDHKTKNLLFRYFDNTAQPGHSYRYRVRLAMVDVNHKVQPQYLDKTVTARREETGDKKYRWTDWSEISPVASVPLPARVYLVGNEPAREGAFTDEPEAEILIKALNSEYAAEIARTEDFTRGNVINIFDKAKVVWASRAKQVDYPSFSFRTGITVLDLVGGEKLSRDMNSTSRILLMDAAGHLFIQNELDDLETTEEYEAIIEGAQNDRTRGGGRGGYGGEYGGGEFGRE